jgi:hypothetical protein
MTRKIELKSCHLWGVLWFGVIGVLIYPMILNTSNLLSYSETRNMCDGYYDFYNHSQIVCVHDYMLGGNAGHLYFFFIGNLILIGVTIFTGLHWLNKHYKWIEVNIKSCWQ